MKKLLIHIGTGKTGTTSIQQSLLAAQRANALGSVCFPDFLYPRWRYGNPHHMLACCYRPDRVPRVFGGGARAEQLNALLPEFRRELDAWLHKYPNVILSTEYMAGLSLQEIGQFREDVGAFHFDEAAVVIYVRNPVDIYLARVSQTLRASSHVPSPLQFRYRFRRAISTWSRIFGGRIIVRPFDRALLQDGCVVRDFVKVSSDFFGQPINGVRPINLNESLSAEACVIVQKYRSLFHGSADNLQAADSRNLVRALQLSRSALPQTRLRVHREIERYILEQHRDDMAWLRSRYGIDFCRIQEQPVGGTWTAPSRKLEVGDIMDTDPRAVEALLYHVLRFGLQRRQSHRRAG